MMANRIVALALVFFAASAGAQQLSAAEDDSSAPPVDSWPTYHGDYSGRHYSTQGQITPANVKGLSLAWIYRATNNTQGAITGGTAPPPRPDGGGGAGRICSLFPYSDDQIDPAAEGRCSVY